MNHYSNMDYWNAFGALVVIYIGYNLVRNYRRYYERLENIRQKRVAVTGCDTGFGKLLAEHLDKIGVITYAGCLLQSSVDQFNEKHKNIKAFQLDITSEESVDKAAEFVKKDLNGRALWAIVNNAGVAGNQIPLEWHSKSDFQKVFDVNLFGAIDFTKKFLGLVKQGREGRVVNMSSILGRIAVVGCAYTVSKYAMEGYSDSLSFEMRAFNISVHVIEPSFFKTKLMGPLHQLKGFLSRHFETLSDELKSSYGKSYCEKRDELVLKTYNMASEKFEDLIDAYDHALFAKYPKSRYQVNNDAKFLFVPVSFLPVPRQFKIIQFFRWMTKAEKVLPAQAVK